MDAAVPCPPLVLIEWLDSGQPVPGWQWLETIEPRQPHLCVSVGFLVRMTQAPRCSRRTSVRATATAGTRPLA
jgi:hypothetical protein